MKVPSALLRFSWILPTIIFALLVFLGSLIHPLWGDEAETALFGRSILIHGVPYGWDGVNIMGINDAVVLNKDLINHKSPWAQYYTVALSFLFFGESSFTARFPFILISILTFPLLYAMILQLTKSKKIAVVSLLILSLSPVYIMFAYQARYYALTALCSVGLTYALWHLGEKKTWPKVAFAGFSALFFYSNYVAFFAFLTSLIAAYLVYLLLQKRKADARKTLITLVLLGIPVAIFTLPWLLIVQPSSGGEGVIVPPQISLEYILGFFRTYYDAYAPYNLNNGLPILLLLSYVVVLVLSRNKKVFPLYLFLFLLPVIYFFFMTVITIATQVETSFTHSRYTMNIFPFFSLLLSVLIIHIWQWRKLAGVIVLIVYLATSFFTVFHMRSLPFEFVNEMLNPYKTPDVIVADYLKEHAWTGQTAFVSLDRDHEPLIFHLKDKLRFVNRISPTNRSIFPENRGTIPRYIYYFLERPDWIILYSKRTNEQNFLTFDYRGSFPLGLAPGINLGIEYEETVLPIFFSDFSRPEIEHHSFAAIVPEADDRIFIYKKKN